MKFKVFSIFDSKAEAFSQPFLFHTEGLAIRAFAEMSQDPQSKISVYAPDFTLFEIAEFDDNKGEYEMLPFKKNLGTALQYQVKSQAKLEIDQAERGSAL